MYATYLSAFGYLSIFLPFALMAVGQVLDLPYLAAAVVLGLGPLSRVLLGNVSDELPDWSERTTTALDRIPTLYAASFPVMLAAVLAALVSNRPDSVYDWIWSGLSLWVCLFFSVVVAHELIHQPQRRRLGWLLAGASGYPLLAHEHISHHSTSGNVELAEWPRRDESVWRFSMRRMQRILSSSLEFNAMTAARQRRSKVFGGLLEALGAFLIVAGVFWIALGSAGLIMYFAVAVGVHFGVQAVTYLQHWGLGADSVADASEGRYAWEDRCQFQAWLMLHLALHQAHHHQSSRPYYQLAPHPSSPRLPAGYVLLLFASLVPPLWRWLMSPALESWKEDRMTHVEPARWRLVCLPRHYGGQGKPKAALP